LGDVNNSWLGRVDYPTSYRNLVFDFETTFYFQQQHGVSINTAIADNISVSGYEAIGFGNYMRLNSKIMSYSLNYAYRTKNKQLNLFLGPSYIIHKVNQESGTQQIEEPHSNKFGLYLGTSIHFIEKEKWFLAFKANLRLASKSEIGPYTVEYQSGILTDNPETYTSEYKKVKVNLNTLNVGIAVGLKFDNQ